MLAMSTAAADDRPPLERAARNRLMLGLFVPLQDGGWSPSTSPRTTTWTFPYNANLVVRAEELGFDLAFGLAQWLPAGGHGGRMRYREQQIDPLVATAGMAALTRNIILISTVHVLYGWHPLQLAKIGATIDHMSKGRWGLNIVTGYKRGESGMFGIDDIPHDSRYAMAEEFTEMLLELWRRDENVTRDGRWWRLKDAYVSPKSPRGAPILVNAGTSPAGIEFAARYADLMFITSPGGSNIADACESLPDHVRRIKEIGRKHGRDVKLIINPHIICRETDHEATERVRYILEGADEEAARNFSREISGGDTSGWRKHNLYGWTLGGNVQIVGSPETVVDWLVKLSATGVDGVQINFFDFAPDLEFFGERVLPLLKQAGLRAQ